MAIVATIACAQEKPVSGDRAVISDGWKLSREGVAMHYDAPVPSTVAGVLSEAGVFGDALLEGRNYEKVDKSIFDDTWTYATTFAGKPGKGQHAELVFDGLNYYADIFLNGKQIASSDTTAGVFIRRAYDVTKLLKKNNKLEVKLRRAQSGDLNHGYVDWNPRPLDESMGIVRPVTLHTTGALSIEDIYVIPDLDVENFATADLSVRVRLRNWEEKPVEGTLVLNLQDAETATFPVALAAGETKDVTLTRTDVAALHVDNPRVWWSWDLGKPELYKLAVAVEVENKVSDVQETTFGIRKIESRLTEDNYRQFTLNGKDILLKGAGWSDDIFMRDTPESIERQVRYVMDMNMNLIRFENIWGKDDTVYDLCDELGVLTLVGFSCQWEWENYCGLPEVGHFGCITTARADLENLRIAAIAFQILRSNFSNDLFNYICPSIVNLPVEEFWAIYLNTKRKALFKQRISLGGITDTPVDIRRIFATALEKNAVYIAVAHNHPTGHLNPSREDKNLTCRILEAGKILNIELIDHIIVGIGENNRPDYYSFHDNGLV